MNITHLILRHQAQHAMKEWPFMADLEREFSLPHMILCAVGSRETNLTNEVGDYGHGHGVWQLDNRSHTIPPGFDQDVKAQAHQAALMLHNLIAHFQREDWPRETAIKAALVSYNAGQGTAEYNLRAGMDLDQGTAGDDYGTDTYERLTYLQGLFPQAGSKTPTPVKHPGGAILYVVQKGDSLSSIATSHHVKGGWETLYDANRHTVGNDPNIITPGMRLVIPN